jgi:hypothetical protein
MLLVLYLSVFVVNLIIIYVFKTCQLPLFFLPHKRKIIQGYTKKKYTLSKIYFTSTIEHMVTEGRTLKVIFTLYKNSM